MCRKYIIANISVFVNKNSKFLVKKAFFAKKQAVAKRRLKKLYLISRLIILKRSQSGCTIAMRAYDRVGLTCDRKFSIAMYATDIVFFFFKI